jgi:hypothetical protein
LASNAVSAPSLTAGAKPSFLVSSEADTLAPGNFLWDPLIAMSGPMNMVVDLSSQRAFVYRGGKLIGITTISSGKPGHETPDGTFTVLEKEKMHHSNKYEDAPMPFMQRLGWDGLALHGGHPHGYPASHGCVRLPMGFAAALFKENTRGMQVVITGEAPSRQEILAAGENARTPSQCCAAHGLAGTGNLQAAKLLNTQGDPDAAPCCAPVPDTAPAIPPVASDCAVDRGVAVEGDSGGAEDGNVTGAPEKLQTECTSSTSRPPSDPDYSSNPGR